MKTLRLLLNNQQLNHILAREVLRAHGVTLEAQTPIDVQIIQMSHRTNGQVLQTRVEVSYEEPQEKT